MDVLLKELENTRLEVKMTESKMTVEEAVEYLRDWLHSFSRSDQWWGRRETAIKIVLDELKALQECESCSYKPGEWCQK